LIWRLLAAQNQLGKRMCHCHILEHEHHGTMEILDVVG